MSKPKICKIMLQILKMLQLVQVDKPHRVWPGDPWDLLPESLEGAEIPAIMIAPQHLYDVRDSCPALNGPLARNLGGVDG